MELGGLGALRWLEVLISREQDSRDHGHNTEELCVLDYEENMVSDLVSLFIHRSVDCVHRDYACKCFQEVCTLQEKEGHLPHHFTEIQWPVDDLKL